MKRITSLLTFLFASLIIAFAQTNISPINIGVTNNDKTGDTLRVAFGKVNANFTYVTNLLSLSTNGFVTASITNGLATTNYVQSYAKNSTNGFTALVYTNPTAVLYTNSLPALTNGFVTASITNGLATTNYVNSATNNLPKVSYYTVAGQSNLIVQFQPYTNTIPNPGFESNTISPWSNGSITTNAHSGLYALDSGAQGGAYATAVTNVLVPNIKFPYLVLWTKSIGLDGSVFTVLVNNNLLGYTTYSTAWVSNYFDLSAYAGQTVSINLSFDDSGGNNYSELLLDDITVGSIAQTNTYWQLIINASVIPLGTASFVNSNVFLITPSNNVWSGNNVYNGPSTFNTNIYVSTVSSSLGLGGSLSISANDGLNVVNGGDLILHSGNGDNGNVGAGNIYLVPGNGFGYGGGDTYLGGAWGNLYLSGGNNYVSNSLSLLAGTTLSFDPASRISGTIPRANGINLTNIQLTNVVGYVTNYVTASNPTNSYTTGTIYTNTTPSRALLIGSAILTSSTTGSANLTINYTNSGVAYVLPLQESAGVNMTNIVPFTVPLNKSATFKLTATSGTGASVVTTNVVLWQL